MASMQMTFSPAQSADEDQLVALMRPFYEHEHIPFVEAIARAMLRAIAANPSYGEAHLIRADGRVAGYVITTLGFSVEFGGRYAVLDELFVLEPFRGKGLGRASLRFVEDRCRQHGIQTLRLEVNHDNLRAREVYRRADFFDQERHLLTKRIVPNG